MDGAHSISVDQVYKSLQTSSQGLSSASAAELLSRHGANVIPESGKKGVFSLLVSQLNSFLIYILILAAAVSFWIGHLVDMWLIIAIVIINATIGFIQEYKAERSVAALKNLVVPTAHVFRDNVLRIIKAADLVPGDLILLQEGDKIPADGRLIQSNALTTIESPLTGESLPVVKNTAILPSGTPVADRANMVWLGTDVACGEGLAIVTATGPQTGLGRVASSLENIGVQKGPFWKKTRRLALQLGLIAIAGALFTFVVGFFVRDIEFSEIFLFTLASLVAGIPEGLPAVIIIVLAIGANRMAAKNVIIRRLPATETLGHVNVIATDKTGTITQNTMQVERITLACGSRYFLSNDQWQGEPGTEEVENTNDLRQLLRICALCNNSRNILCEDAETTLGDPTEMALAQAALKGNITPEGLTGVEERIADMPFNREYKLRATLVESHERERQRRVYVIGAPEAILDLSDFKLVSGVHLSLAKADREVMKSTINDLSAQGMRVLACGLRNVPVETAMVEPDTLRGITLCGLVAMHDPVRAGVSEAVNKAKNAGIRVIMKTGDHRETASSIAREIGLLADNQRQVLTESDLSTMSQAEFTTAVSNCDVFARLTPATKLRIVDNLQSQGAIVAMTGDGVNDAPALKKADVGIAMGKIGTDVARAASDVILADDNFISIVEGVKEGRIVFHNIRRVTWFLVTTNLAEDITIIAALLVGFDLPLLPVHILWLNLITDGLVVLALATEPGHSDILEKPQAEDSRGILSREVIPWFVIMSLLMTGCTLFIFNRLLPYGIDMARTGAFAILAICQLFNVLNMRSVNESVFRLGMRTNMRVLWALIASVLPLVLMFYVGFLREIFRFESLSLQSIIEILVLGSIVLWTGELYKLLRYHIFGQNQPGKTNSSTTSN